MYPYRPRFPLPHIMARPNMPFFGANFPGRAQPQPFFGSRPHILGDRPAPLNFSSAPPGPRFRPPTLPGQPLQDLFNQLGI